MKLHDMGIKRKELHPESSEPKSEKDYENEVDYIEVNTSGKHAENMGAEKLKAGDTFTQICKWRVKSHEKRDADGKISYSMTLCLDEASEPEIAEPEEEDEEDEEETDSEASPALRYLQGIAARG